MKTLLRFVLAACLLNTTYGQGTVQFQVLLEPIPEFSLHYEPSRGDFSLNGSVLSGEAVFQFPANTSFIRIENPTKTSLFLPVSVEDLAPTTAYLATWTDIQLTENQVNELMQGTWRVSVGGGSYPDGALVGQLQVVPEPSSLAFLGFSFAAFWLLKKPRAERLSLQPLSHKPIMRP